jgi:hypothetical protein
VIAGGSPTPHRTRHPAALLLAALAGGGALLAGCGGSGPTKAEYTAKANTICRGASTHTVPLVGRLTSAAGSLSAADPAAARRLAGTLEQLHTVAATTLAQLQALAQPAGDRAAIERFSSSLAVVAETLRTTATAGGAGQPRETLAQLEATAADAGRMASAAGAYGLNECATLLGPLGGATVAQPTAAVHGTFVGESHHPTVNQPWRYTVTVTDAHGHKLSGTETTQYTLNGAVVGTEKPENVKFTGGVYRNTIEFPAAAVGFPLTVQAVVRTGEGSATATWPVKVRR